MSASLLAGVTVHGEGSVLPYTCAGLRERDFQFAPYRIDLREIDPPVDQAVAIGADAAQAAREWAGGSAFRHFPGRDLRLAAGDAENPPWPASLLRLLPAFM